MFSPRLQYADQEVKRPKRIYDTTPNVPPNKAEAAPANSDINTIFKRLLKECA